MSAPMPNTFVVGAGPVAVALAGGLRLAGVPVLGLWARRGEAARSAAAVAGVAAYSGELPEVLSHATTAIVAVRDDAIFDVASRLVASGRVGAAHVLIHCSGALSSAEAFGGVRDSLAGVGVLHPLRSIADGAAAMRDLAGTVFGVEGDARGLERARALVTAMQGQSLELAGADFAAYHAAAALVSNCLVALVDVGAELLGRAGIERERAVRALLPLASGTIDNLRRQGLPTALTGPIRRGDRDTVARHLGAMTEAPGIAEIYRSLGHRLVELARSAGGADPSDLDAIATLLGAGAGR